MAGKQRMRLTNSVIARLRPRKSEYTVWDTRVTGLGVRVRPSGGASFVFLRKVEGRSRRLSLGPVLARQPRGRGEFVFPSPQDADRPRARDLAFWYSLRRDALVIG